MRETIVWALVALTLALVGLVWIRPMLQTKAAPVTQLKEWSGKGLLFDKSLPPAHYKEFTPAPTVPPTLTQYQKIKGELNDWGGILSKFSPAVVAILALIVRKGGKKKK
jgi:hypothetical protein